MKNLTTLLLSLSLLPVYAQNKPDEVVNVKIECYNTMKIFTELQKVYKEIPIILGKTSDEAGSTMTLWISPTEKTWTIVATKEKLSCIVGTGSDAEFSPIFLKKKDLFN
jgi:hypothetical protein